MVLVACRLDAAIGSDFIRDAAVIGFSVNEALSIVENAGLMGVPVPRVIVSAIHVLRERGERGENREQAAGKDIGDGGGEKEGCEQHTGERQDNSADDAL